MGNQALNTRDIKNLNNKIDEIEKHIERLENMIKNITKYLGY